MTGITVMPDPAPPAIAAAIAAGGGDLVGPTEASALVWLGDDPARLAAVLRPLTGITWVQLPWTGVEGYLPYMTDGRLWTCARGVYAIPVAEHALMLTLMCLRGTGEAAAARRWLPRPPRVLAGADVTIVGAGAVARALIALLEPFGTRVTVVRRRPEAVVGAESVIPFERADAALATADVVVLAAPLTAATRGLLDARRLRLMKDTACLVNVGRGALVNTGDLYRALADGGIAAAGLDVTEPEPLPAAHPLWTLPNCVITAHSASDPAASLPDLARLLRHNVSRWTQGLPPDGAVSTKHGY